MYVVRDKKTKQILHVNPASLTSKLKGKQIYAEYNSKTMETLKSPTGTVPEHYSVDKDGNIQPMTLAEKVEAGIHALAPHQKLHEGKIVAKSLAEKVADGVVKLREPFEFLNEQGGIAHRTLDDIAAKLKKTCTARAHCDAALGAIGSALEAALAQHFSPSKEIALMKDYLMWLDDGSPKNDERPTAFRAMKEKTLEIREKYRQMKAALQKHRETLPEEKPATEPAPQLEAELPATAAKAEKPTKANTVAEIKAWLDGQQIEYAAKAKKADLLKLVKKAHSAK